LYCDDKSKHYQIIADDKANIAFSLFNM